MNVFKRWKKGLRELTPSQLLHAKLVGYAGSTIGLILAWIVLWFRGMWFFSVIMFFAIFLNVISYITTWQQWKTMCEFQDSVNTLGDDQLSTNIKELTGGIEDDETNK